jgi:hypothetical protein
MARLTDRGCAMQAPSETRSPAAARLGIAAGLMLSGISRRFTLRGPRPTHTKQLRQPAGLAEVSALSTSS